MILLIHFVCFLVVIFICIFLLFVDWKLSLSFWLSWISSILLPFLCLSPLPPPPPKKLLNLLISVFLVKNQRNNNNNKIKSYRRETDKKKPQKSPKTTTTTTKRRNQELGNCWRKRKKRRCLFLFVSFSSLFDGEWLVVSFCSPSSFNRCLTVLPLCSTTCPFSSFVCYSSSRRICVDNFLSICSPDERPFLSCCFSHSIWKIGTRNDNNTNNPNQTEFFKLNTTS